MHSYPLKDDLCKYIYVALDIHTIKQSLNKCTKHILLDFILYQASDQAMHILLYYNVICNLVKLVLTI